MKLFERTHPDVEKTTRSGVKQDKLSRFKQYIAIQVTLFSNWKYSNDIYFDSGFITYAIVNSPESEFCQICPAPTRTKSYTRIDSFIEIGLKPQAVTPDFWFRGLILY